MENLQPKVTCIGVFHCLSTRKRSQVASGWKKNMQNRKCYESSLFSSNCEDSLESEPARSFISQVKAQDFRLDSHLRRLENIVANNKVNVIKESQCVKFFQKPAKSEIYCQEFFSKMVEEELHCTELSSGTVEKEPPCLDFPKVPEHSKQYTGRQKHVKKNSLLPKEKVHSFSSNSCRKKPCTVTNVNKKTISCIKQSKFGYNECCSTYYRNKRDKNNVSSRNSRRKIKIKNELLLLELKELELRNKLLKEKESLLKNIVKEITTVGVLFFEIF